jgi:PAS domain S-box-containing protein
MSGKSEPDNRIANGLADEAWPSWYERFVFAGLSAAFLLAVAAFVVGPGSAPLWSRVATYIVLPASILGSVALARAGRPRFLFVAALLLDLESLFMASLMAVGLAFTVLVPLVGLALILEESPRLQAVGFVAAGVSAFTGIALALMYGPASQTQDLSDPVLVFVGTAVFIAVGLGQLFRFNLRRTQALEAAEAELASRRAAEAELERTSQVLSAIVMSSPVPTQVLDAAGKVMYWNPASERVFGWSSEEVVGKSLPEEMTPEDDRAASADRIRRTMAGELIAGDRVRRLTKDGRERWADIYAAALHGADGTPLGIAGQLVDVTEQVSMESRLRQASKMEAIGVLAGGVAHDFNNLLTAIRGYTELVRSGLPDEMAHDRADLDEVMAAADKAGQLTRQLLAFARRTVLEPRVLDPAIVVSNFVPMLRRLLGEDIELVLTLAPDTGWIRVDPVQLEQIVLNLAVNARDAMPQGGRLDIKTANVDLDREFAVPHPDRKPGPWMRLSVSDTGVGMDRATMGRVFEPFFTTKETGTGMGLATVFGIVEMSEGWIDVRSEPGRGSTFELYFPRVSSGAQDGGGTEKPPDAAMGRETILLVEDDPAVRGFGRRCLTQLGYEVLEASNGDDALNLAGSYSGSIALLMTDMVMPGMQGQELSRRLTGFRPAVRTLYCSGFPDKTPAGNGDFHGAYLAKPYNRESLARAVREVLDHEA